MEDLDALLTAALTAPAADLRACLEALVADAGPDRARTHLQRAARGLPAQRSVGPGLEHLALVVERAENLEALTRPLLEVLHDLTGLASIYLTVVHRDEGEQEIRYSLNTLAGFALPEGLHVPWADTLCQRALLEGRACTTDVPAVWGDSAAAAELGIRTYVSVPVRMPDGLLWGTLCAADSRPAEGAERHLPTMGMIARLIGVEVQRAAAHAEAQRAAEVDPLTGCANRRGIDAWLSRAREAEGVVCAVYVDLDEFKAVNDVYGHTAGDAVLREAAAELRRHLRTGDLVGRLGGDEFLVAAVMDPAQTRVFLARWPQRLQLSVDTGGGTRIGVRASVGSAVVAPADVDGLLAAADSAMYAVKARRRAPGPGSPPAVAR